MISDYFAAEQPIISQIAATVPGLLKVGSWVDFKSVLNGAIVTPAAFVVWRGDKVNAQAAQYVSLVEQYWSVALTVRAPATQDTQAASRSEAGPLLAAIIQTLRGWVPAPGHSPLKLAVGADPLYLPGGSAVFTVTFMTQVPI